MVIACVHAHLLHMHVCAELEINAELEMKNVPYGHGGARRQKQAEARKQLHVYSTVVIRVHENICEPQLPRL